MFGFHTFGTVYGLANSLSGLFGLILRPLDVLTRNRLNGNYNPVNILGLVLGTLVSAILSIRIWVAHRRIILE